MSCLSCLPDEVLKAIMALIPFKDRLTSCCLVSKKLHAAAIAATECLDLPALSPQPSTTGSSLPGWLRHYGQHLTRLHLGIPCRLLRLPCPMLLELKLSSLSCKVKLNATHGCLGALQQCTKLTRLELQCTITDISHEGQADGLSSLVNLQHLEMKPTFGPRALSGATLPRLQCLTHLDVNALSIENLLQLGGLTSLQELTLWSSWLVAGPRYIPGLTFPGSLKKLFLSRAVEGALLSLLPTGLEELEVKLNVEGPAEGPDSFLSGLARLQSLTRLLIAPIRMAWPPAGPAYGALTASSNLVSLEVTGVTGPDGIWPYLFPATHKLPQLTGFVWYPGPGEGDDDEDAFSPSWGAADLAGLVSCCPGLCEVQTLHMQPGMQVSELHKLTALTSLFLSYNCEDLDDFGDSVRGMAVLSQLHKLEVTQVCEHFRVSSLLPLTSLTALVHLKVQWSPGAGAGDDDDDYLHCTTSQVNQPRRFWHCLMMV